MALHTQTHGQICFSLVPLRDLLEAAVVEKGLEGKWNIAGPVNQSEDNDGLFVI